jgi:Flp pilus assembly CpaE family ATPase
MCNVELKVLILRSGKKQYEIAHELRWHPSKLSTILSEVYTPSSIEREDLCAILGCQVEEAFPSGGRS